MVVELAKTGRDFKRRCRDPSCDPGWVFGLADVAVLLVGILPVGKSGLPAGVPSLFVSLLPNVFPSSFLCRVAGFVSEAHCRFLEFFLWYCFDTFLSDDIYPFLLVPEPPVERGVVVDVIRFDVLVHKTIVTHVRTVTIGVKHRHHAYTSSGSIFCSKGLQGSHAKHVGYRLAIVVIFAALYREWCNHNSAGMQSL